MRQKVFLILIFHFFFYLSKAQGTIDHWEMIVKADQLWKYHIGTVDPGDGWNHKDFDDASWSEGTGGVGYGDNDDGTVINSASSVFLRITFAVQDTRQIEEAILLADYDDAYIAYLNGIEIARSGISGSPPSHDQYADSQQNAHHYQTQ
jgi:hypothetical protein